MNNGTATHPATLLLWDIDGTLVNTGQAGELALVDSLREKFGIESTLDGIEIAGRTDWLIARAIVEKHALHSRESAVDWFMLGYLEALARRLHERRPHGYLYPGIASIIEQADADQNFAQGLLTGNLSRGAELKLSLYGIWHYFPFGGFADDAEERNEIAPHALRRATEHWARTFDPDRVFVIGDTPYDVACGKAIGARTIAVATGRFSEPELQSTGADYVFDSFEDCAAFWRVVSL